MGCSSSGAAGRKPLHARFEIQDGRAFAQRYIEGDLLDSGAFGAVRRLHLLKPDPDLELNLATKVVVTRKDTEQEAKVWHAAGGHDNVLELLEAFIETEGSSPISHFVTEICMGNLLSEQCRPLLQYEASFAVFAAGMVAGVSHVHSKGILHRDIKPKNFLVAMDAATVKLCDFGTARWLEPGQQISGIVGSFPYMAPEVANKGMYNFSADIWSLGATCYLMLMGAYAIKPPKGVKPSKENFREAVIDPKHVPSYRPHRGWPAWPQPQSETRSFLEEMLRRDPQSRTILKDLAAHPFLTTELAWRKPLLKRSGAWQNLDNIGLRPLETCPDEQEMGRAASFDSLSTGPKALDICSDIPRPVSTGRTSSFSYDGTTAYAASGSHTRLEQRTSSTVHNLEALSNLNSGLGGRPVLRRTGTAQSFGSMASGSQGRPSLRRASTAQSFGSYSSQGSYSGLSCSFPANDELVTMYVSETETTAGAPSTLDFYSSRRSSSPSTFEPSPFPTELHRSLCESPFGTEVGVLSRGQSPCPSFREQSPFPTEDQRFRRPLPEHMAFFKDAWAGQRLAAAGPQATMKRSL